MKVALKIRKAWINSTGVIAICMGNFLIHCYPKLCLPLHEQKIQPRQRSGQGNIYYLQQVKRHQGTSKQHLLELTAKLEKF